MGQKFIGQTSSYNSLFKPLSYCFEEIIGHDVKVSFASRPVSRLIQSDDIKNFLRKDYLFPRDFSWIENYELITSRTKSRSGGWCCQEAKRELGINFPMKHARRDDSETNDVMKC